jgi:hypothetical protein
VDALDPSLFIGSSSEGLPIAYALQAELDAVCEPLVWSQGVFAPTGTTIGSLLEQAQNSDFAALVVTPDDLVVTRDAEVAVARDNVIFELGLFLGALGPQRVFIIQPRDQDLRLPSDLAGITCLNYRSNRRDRDLQGAIGPAATSIRNRISTERLRSERELPQSISPAMASRRGLTIDEEQRELDRELDAIVKAAEAQGWTVRTRSSTAFRLVARNGKRYSLAIGSPADTRDRLRQYAEQLSSAGLRPSRLVLRPVNDEGLCLYPPIGISRRNRASRRPSSDSQTHRAFADDLTAT